MPVARGLRREAPGAPVRALQEVAMNRHHPVAKLAASLAALFALVSASPATAQDDSALFSTSVAPNVVFVVDNSGSMNEIMWHPNFTPNVATNCSIFGKETPNVGSGLPSSGSGTVNGMPYTCDATYCRLQLPNANSGSTTGFVSTGTYSCPSGGTQTAGYFNKTFCGRTRRLFIDPDNACRGNPTWYSEEYVEWLFSAAAGTYFLNTEPNTSTDVTKIDANRNGVHYVNGQPFPLFKRARITAAKEVARDVIYQINSNCSEGQGFPCPTGGKDVVRFGIGRFDGGPSTPGGFVTSPVGNYSSNAAALDSAISALDAETSTPLAETLFKVYTYFMSRGPATERPLGVLNGTTTASTTRFPIYAYRTSDGDDQTPVPPDPLSCPPANVKCSCQKNFVILLTDGIPTNDDFAISGNDGTGGNNSNTVGRTRGFGDFATRLIGDYNQDGEVEVPGVDGRSLYLDDIAKFMHERDFRPDIPDLEDGRPQTIDVYTIGFATDAAANALLQKTAQVGGGLFFTSTQAEELTDQLVRTIREVIEKSQAFTAATVPATRTQFGGKFYNSLFVPVQDSGYWEGSLLSWHITEDGEILDSTGACAFEGNPSPCTAGRFDAGKIPFWDAGDAVPAPASRNLYTSHIVGTTPTRLAFTAANITETHLNLTVADGATYPYQPPAVNPGVVASLADMVVWNVRGCKFGTGFGAVACQPRTDRATIQHRLGDIFHSNPVVVPRPRAFEDEPSYVAFKSPTGNPTVGLRDQVIVAGANDGIFRIFDAGTWNASPPSGQPAGYTAGTGAERAGFIPYSSRQKVKHLARDSGTRDFYYTDGSPTVADVWLYTSPTVSDPASKTRDEWKTVVISGMRDGGNQYFALDITKPSDAGYPGYLWEYPRENDPVSITSTMGRSWSDPVITKVKVAVNGDVANPQDRWVAIIGGGYDPTGDPNTGFYNIHATAGRSLTMLDIKTGRILGQKKFVDTPAATDPAALVYNSADPQRSMAFAMASAPAVLDLDFDGYADVVYIGDLGGNVWKWVIRNIGHDPVNSTNTTTQQNGTEATGLSGWYFGKLFATPPYPALPAAGPRHYRSFFFRPAATLKNNVLWLAFGSGERAALQYAGVGSTTLENNRFFSLKDLDPFEETPSTTPITEAAPRGMLDLTSTQTCTDVDAYDGFYIRGIDGEKFITNVDVIDFKVLVATYTPTAASTDPCVAGGDAAFYFFNIFCREGGFEDPSGNPVSSVALGKGLPTDPRISLSGTSGEAFINKGDRVESIDIGITLEDLTGMAWWKELFQDPEP
jgi:type IV pilus assembly protein PilY1